MLELIWNQGVTTAKEVQAALPRHISLSTVQSTLERLNRKRLLKRRKCGHAFRYSADVSKVQVIVALVVTVLSRLHSDSLTSARALAGIIAELI